MSKLIRTRNPQQCRSHHQKMLIKYGSIDKIVAEFRGNAEMCLLKE